MKTVALIVAFAGLLAGAVYILVRFWPGFADTSPHMWAALSIGVIASLALGVGLMALSFHSNSSGHDDAIGYDD